MKTEIFQEKKEKAPSQEVDFKEELLSLSNSIPAIEHPWFKRIINKEFTKDQIIRGEFQHYLRVRLNAKIFGAIVENATVEEDFETLNLALKNFREEMCEKKTHGDLMFQFLEELGVSKEEASKIEPMPGTLAAISMLTQSIKTLSSIEGIAMLSLSELQNGGKEGIAAQVYKSLKEHYKFSDYAIETFLVHSVEDVDHGENQVNFLIKRVEEQPELREKILRAAKFGIYAFNFEWDGHYQAAIGKPHEHWVNVKNEY